VSRHDADGQSGWVRVTRSNPCPACGKADWCSITADGQAVKCMRVSSHPQYGAGVRQQDGGYLYRLATGSDSRQEPRYCPADGEGKLADADTRHRVYSDLFKHLPLEQRHARDLKKRGLTDAEIRARQYRTLGRVRAAAIRKLVEAGLEPILPTIPGCYVETKAGRRYWTLSGMPGLIVPVRDLQTRVIALLDRPDDPEGGKYLWLTSATKGRGGASPGAPLHFPLFTGDRQRVRITEGALKADVATALSGTFTLGLPGVASWRLAADALHNLGASVVLVSFDADARVKPPVAQALLRLVEDLQGDFTVELETWPLASGKGIDDLLVRGVSPEVLTGDAVLAEARQIVKESAGQDATPADGKAARTFSNYEAREVHGDDGKTSTTYIGLPIQRVGQELFRLSGGWPKRVDSLLFVEGPDHQPLWLGSPDALFAWLGRLLPDGDCNGLHWAGGYDKITQSQFFAYLQQTAECFQSVEVFPHEPPLPGHFYLLPPAKGGDGRALRQLLQRFQPLTDADYDLMLAFVLTLLWGGRPGQRPACLVTTDDEGDQQKGRGTGKSTLAKVGGRLVGGLVTASARDDMAKLITRLLTPAHRTIRCVLLDNIKSLKFSWGELEAIITSDVVSGHQMYAGEGRRPNTLVWCLTVNGASLSRDMAQRAIPIMVKRAQYTATWENETLDLVDATRWQIIGDCLTLLREPPKPLDQYTRWASWEAGVLSHVADPAECQKVIQERQGAIDEDAGESQAVREAFRLELQRRGHRPDDEAVWISAVDAAAVVNVATGERFPVNRAGVYLGTLAIPELRKSDGGGVGPGVALTPTWKKRYSPSTRGRRPKRQ
jgi:hypothetical protein